MLRKLLDEGLKWNLSHVIEYREAMYSTLDTEPL